MCDFCKVDENGDIASNFLFDETVLLKESADGKDKSGVFNLKASFEESISLCAQINGGDEYGDLSLMAYIDDTENPPLDFTKTIKINYCPMCGRKL